EPREVAPDGVAGSAEAGDEECRRTAGFPDCLRIGARVVGDGGRNGEAEQEAEAEEEADGELLGPLRGGVDPEQQGKGGDVRADCPVARGVAADVGAEREDTRGEGNEAHRLAEQRTRLATAERRPNGCGGG